MHTTVRAGFEEPLNKRSKQISKANFSGFVNQSFQREGLNSAIWLYTGGHVSGLPAKMAKNASD